MTEEIPGPGEAVGYRLVGGEEDGEDFVADLFVGHAGLLGGVVGLVFAGEEHGEEIAAIWFTTGGCFAVLADEAVYYGVEAGFRVAEIYEAGDGEVKEGLDFGEGYDEVVEVPDGV